MLLPTIRSPAGFTGRLCSVGLLLILCACATGYGPRDPWWRNWGMGGWYETQLGEDRYRVSFFGNGATSDDRASDFALLRACDLAIENGYDYFIIEASESGVAIGYTQVGPAQTTAGPVSIAVSAAAPTHTYPSPSHTVVYYEERPEDLPQHLADLPIIDARSQRDQLRRKYELTD